MLAENQLPNHPILTLVARALFTSLFLISGVTHFTNIPYYVSLMHEAIPFRVQLTLVSGVVELAGAVMILFNWRPRLGGWLLVLFLIPVTIVVHGYEMIYAEGERIACASASALFQRHCADGRGAIHYTDRRRPPTCVAPHLTFVLLHAYQLSKAGSFSPRKCSTK